MQFYDDGKVGLSFEPLIGVLRLLPRPATGGLPDFTTSGVLMRVTDTVCKLVGFSGSMSIRHQALIVRSLRKMGFEVLYVERSDGGTIAFGEPVTEGDFKGCIRMDLVKAEARAKRRYAVAAA